MHYVYLIKSSRFDELYVGLTNDIDRRLKEHNRGKVSSTKSAMPWDLVTYIAFSDRAKAEAFEKYLKSHSGRAFLKKRLV